MRPYIEENHSCYIVDYNQNPIPGVTRLGDDIQHIGNPPPFDVILCSHVLEHVAGLRELLTQLRQRLAPNGIIYAEVPSEMKSS